MNGSYESEQNMHRYKMKLVCVEYDLGSFNECGRNGARWQSNRFAAGWV